MTEVIKKINNIARNKNQTPIHAVTCTEPFKNDMNCHEVGFDKRLSLKIKTSGSISSSS